MNLDYLVPSWLEIESRVTDQMGYQGGAHFRNHLNEPVASLALNLRRLKSVRAKPSATPNGKRRTCSGNASPSSTSTASSMS